MDETLPVLKPKKPNDWVPKFLDVVITLAFIGVIYSLMFVPMVDTNNIRDVLLVMLGALGSAFGLIINYHRSSSAGSKSKTDLLANAPNK